MPGNIFIINAHEYYPFSEGKLNAALVDRASSILSDKGYAVQVTTMQGDYEVPAEIERHLWADTVIIQSPCTGWGCPGASSATWTRSIPPECPGSSAMATAGPATTRPGSTAPAAGSRTNAICCH